jgi:Ca2+-binding EF-hand superfamily protein
MGGKGSKDAGKASKAPSKPGPLTKKDIEYLTKTTGLSKENIENLFKQFNADNPDGKLDRAEFAKLYPKLRNEPVNNLDEIAAFVFKVKLSIIINTS